MEKITDFIESKIAPALIKFSNLKYIQIIQRTFIAFTALLIIGSLFTLLANLPKELIGDFSKKFALGAGVGTSFMGLFTCVAAAYATIEWYNTNRDEHIDFVAPLILAVSSFFVCVPATTVKTVVEGSDKPGSFVGVATDYLGTKGVFAALIIGILTIEIYRFFVNHKVTIKMPEGVPPMVANAFTALIPSFFAIVFWWLVTPVFGLNIPKMIMDLFTPLVSASDSVAAAFITSFLNRALWAVGIHGGNVVGSVANPVWLQMTAENQAAYAAGQPLPYTFTSIFYDNYVWVGLLPLAMVMLTTKSKRLKTLGGLALLPALFNIGEPLIFGIPIVLNPLMMIPFVLSYMVVLALACVLTLSGIIPVPVLSAPWITPAPIKTFLAAGAGLGAVPAVVFVIVAWLIVGLIFYPFVKAIEKNDLDEAEAIEEADAEKATDSEASAE